MTDVNSLPPDQRAVVQLLLAQGKTYSEIAGLLRIEPDAVRQRAHTAVDSLGPETARLNAERRGEIADYLLGQQGVAERDATRAYLSASATGRAWARVVGSELKPLVPDDSPLPEIPEQEEGHEGDLAAVSRSQASDTPRSSRLGGALLLGGLGILLAVALVLILSGGDDDKGGSDRVDTAARTSTRAQAGQAEPIAQVNLLPAQRGSKAVGLAQVFAQGNRRSVVVAGQDVKPGAYAIWLYSSPTKAKLLGFVPARVGNDGRFVTQGELPADADTFTKIIVSQEKVAPNQRQLPKKPGAIILRGPEGNQTLKDVLNR